MPLRVRVLNDQQQAINDVATPIWLLNKKGEDYDLNLSYFPSQLNEKTDKLIVGDRITVYQYGADLNSLTEVELDNPENSRYWICPMISVHETTDVEGRFEFALGDGNFDIRTVN